jgi:ribosomal protein S30
MNSMVAHVRDKFEELVGELPSSKVSKWKTEIKNFLSDDNIMKIANESPEMDLEKTDNQTTDHRITKQMKDYLTPLRRNSNEYIKKKLQSAHQTAPIIHPPKSRN